MMRKKPLVCTFTATVFLSLINGAAFSQDATDRAEAPFVTSDVATLKTVVVFSVGDNIFKSSEMGGGLPFFSMGLPKGTIEEHAALVDLLKREGVQVLDVRDLLQSALENARRRSELGDWLREVFPVTAEQAIERIDEIDADSLLNRRDDHFYLHASDGTLDPLFPGMSSMYWARDFAASTPKGIIIGNSQRFTRSLENSFARFMFRYADELRDIPVVFDAVEEGVHLDGGDVIVLDEQTLLVGVDNRSSREAASRLAQKLETNVIAVNMPPEERRNGLRRQLLHLDSTFNIVDEKTIVAVPYFLEKHFSEINPMKPILLGFARQMEIWDELTEYEIGDPEAIRLTATIMPGVGWVTRYAAGTGEATPLLMKLVDYFRERGFQVVYVGGEQGSLPVEKYAIERAMYELRWQGANVVQLGPGRVIAYEHNSHTNQALRDAGIEVLTFPGHLLSMRNGGPHCLLMPLIRGE